MEIILKNEAKKFFPGDMGVVLLQNLPYWITLIF